jgi:hypothetical protein
VPLQLAGHALEQVLQNPVPEATWREPWAAYRDTLDALVQAMSPALSVDGAAPSTAAAQEASSATSQASAATASQVCARLRQLLRDDDPEALAWADKHAAVLSRALGASHYTELRNALHAFDMDEALQTFERAMAAS